VASAASSRQISSGPPSSTYQDPTGPIPLHTHNYRADDSASGGAVGAVVLPVDARPVLLADRVRLSGSCSCARYCERASFANVSAGVPHSVLRGVVEHRLGRGAYESFGQRLRLRQQRPGPEAEGEPVVGAIPRCVDRHDV
jgi:hypothetical protein